MSDQQSILDGADEQVAEYHALLTNAVGDVRDLLTRHEELCVVVNLMRQFITQDPEKVIGLTAVALIELAGNANDAPNCRHLT